MEGSGMKCPCCGGEMPTIIPTTALSSIPMPESERTILALTVAAYPRAVPSAAIVQGIWGHRADGGALDTRNGIGVRVHRLNKRLKPVGWRVASAGGSWLGRRLVALSPDINSQVRTAGKSPGNGLATHAMQR
jgi:hypothetical protein